MLFLEMSQMLIIITCVNLRVMCLRGELNERSVGQKEGGINLESICFRIFLILCNLFASLFSFALRFWNQTYV